ncbi:MAG: Sec-independent protein translocase subunit TatA/TatB [Candidatus Zhuqueibacterota bacterium]
MFGSIGTPELIIIMFVILLLFGSKRLPELAKGIGKGIRQFKKAMEDVKDEIDINDKNTNLKG